MAYEVVHPVGAYYEWNCRVKAECGTNLWPQRCGVVGRSSEGAQRRGVGGYAYERSTPALAGLPGGAWSLLRGGSRAELPEGGAEPLLVGVERRPRLSRSASRIGPDEPAGGQFYDTNDLRARRQDPREQVSASSLRDVPILVSPDPTPGIEARDLLARVVASSPNVASVVELAARGLIGADAARALGQPRATFYAHEKRLRAALRKLGAASAPKQAPRPTWKIRKRKR